MTAANALLVSISVNNFNYGRFVGEAIDSAMAHRLRSLVAVE
jgi:hypothetical protein